MVKSKILKNRVLLTFGALLCCALWGISTPIVKLGYNYIDAERVPVLIFLAGLQFVLAGALIILFISLLSKKIVFPKRQSFKGIAIISMLQTILQYVLLYVGLLHTTSVKCSVLKCTDVFFIMLISSLIFKQEKLTAIKIISCVIGFAGIVVINLNGLTLDINLAGDAVVLLAIVSYSFSVVLIKKYTRTENPITFCGYQMLLGGAVMCIIGAVTGGAFNIIPLLPIIICLTLFYAVAYTLWTVLLKHNPVARVSIHSFTTPIFGVVFSSLILNEKSGIPTLNIIISLILVCGGIILWSVKQDN